MAALIIIVLIGAFVLNFMENPGKMVGLTVSVLSIWAIIAIVGWIWGTIMDFFSSLFGRDSTFVFIFGWISLIVAIVIVVKAKTSFFG